MMDNTALLKMLQPCDKHLLIQAALSATGDAASSSSGSASSVIPGPTVPSTPTAHSPTSVASSPPPQGAHVLAPSRDLTTLKAEFEALPNTEVRLMWLKERFTFQENVHVNYFNTNHEQNVFRPDCNQRKVGSLSKIYTKSILARSMCFTVTGPPSFVMSAHNKPPFWALSWGTRIVDAFYP